MVSEAEMRRCWVQPPTDASSHSIDWSSYSLPVVGIVSSGVWASCLARWSSFAGIVGAPLVSLCPCLAWLSAETSRCSIVCTGGADIQGCFEAIKLWDWVDWRGTVARTCQQWDFCAETTPSISCSHGSLWASESCWRKGNRSLYWAVLKLPRYPPSHSHTSWGSLSKTVSLPCISLGCSRVSRFLEPFWIYTFVFILFLFENYLLFWNW